MRTISAKDIIESKYIIKNGQIIEGSQGEFYSKQIAKQIIEYQAQNNYQAVEQLIKLDTMQKDKAANKFCLEKYIEVKSIKNEDFIFDQMPTKKHEIYRLKLSSEKFMLINTEYLRESNEKELYYDRNIAFKIYNLKIQLEENIESSFPELIELYQEDIIKKQEEIEELRKEDERKYQEAVNLYKLMKDTGLIDTVKSNINFTRKENSELKEKLLNTNNIVKDLSKKLQIALNKVEELQNKKTGLLEKITGLFKRPKKLTEWKI